MHLVQKSIEDKLIKLNAEKSNIEGEIVRVKPEIQKVCFFGLYAVITSSETPKLILGVGSWKMLSTKENLRSRH